MKVEFDCSIVGGKESVSGPTVSLDTSLRGSLSDIAQQARSSRCGHSVNRRFFDYLYIATTIGLSVYGQLTLKDRIPDFGPTIVSGFAAACLASLAWVAAKTTFDLSHAYPFLSLIFVGVPLLSGCLRSEPLSLQRGVGAGLIVTGPGVLGRG